MKTVNLLSALLFISIVCGSCQDNNYNLKKDIDMNISVGGSQMQVPVGTLEPITLGRFIKTSDVLLLENGKYLFRKSDKMVADVPPIPVVEIPAVSPVFEPQKIEFTMDNLPKGVMAFPPITITGDFKAVLPPDGAQMDISQSIPAEVISISSAELMSPVPLSISIAIAGLPASINEAWFENFSIQFPSYIVFTAGQGVDANNKLTLNKSFNPSGFTLTLMVSGVELEPGALSGGMLKISDKVTLGGTLALRNVTVDPTQVRQLSLTTKALLSSMTFGSITGTFNQKIQVDPFEIAFNDLPDFLTDKGVVLDLHTVSLDIVANNPINVGVDAQMNIVPKDATGAVITQGVVEQNVYISPSTTSRIWISNNQEAMPQNYTFYENSRLPWLFRQVPHSMSMDVVASTDTRDQTQVDMIRNYKIDLDYTIKAPLQFGKDMCIAYNDTFGDVQKSLKDFINYLSELELVVSAVNTIPMDISLSAIPMDAAGKTLSGIIISVEGKILSSASSTVKVVLKENVKGELKKLDKLAMNMTANGATVGAYLEESQDLRLELKARIPGGLNIDLNKK